MLVLPISFRDLWFRHAFARCHDGGGRETTKWTPFGMPRIKSALQSSIFYLYATNPETGEREGPKGTGVLVSRMDRYSEFFRVGTPHIYAVTSYHVAVTSGASIIRVNNLRSSGVLSPTPHEVTFTGRYIDREPHEWHFIPGGDDIAVTDITDELCPEIASPDGVDYIYAVPESDFVTEEFIHKVSISLGEDGFMLGLFSRNSGGEVNYPAARFGNIGQLASALCPVEQGHGVVRPSHVFDIHSRPGFSGSPVFVYRTPAVDLTGINEAGDWTLNTTNNVFLKLLGIHSGQFDDEVEATKAEAYGQLPIVEGDKIGIPSSMTVVAPSWNISKVLDLPALAEQRSVRDEKKLDEFRRSRSRVRPEVEQSKTEPRGSNHDHKEDFTRLLNAAAKEKPQGD